MALFDDMMSTGGAGLLMQVHGAADSIEVGLGSTAKKYDAIVGALRMESVEESVGAIGSTVLKDICRVSIKASPGVVDVDTRLKVAKYDGLPFSVFLIESVTDSFTTVQAWRESVSKVQARGVER